MVRCNNFILYSLLALFHSLLAVSAGDNRCPGGYAEGTTIDIGSYWYECRGGQVIPKGCLTDDHMRMEIQETYDLKAVRMQCILDSAGQLTLIYKSCLQNGREHQAGDQWDDSAAWYTCKKQSNYLLVTAGGCVDGGRRAAIDEKVTKDQVVYQCKKNTDGVPTLVPWGCVAKDGNQYPVGQTFDYGQFVYTCTGNADKVFVKCVGCLNEGRRLGPNDRFVKDDVIYDCAVNDENTDIRPSGCVQRSESGAKIERKLDCFWIEGQPPYQYEMTCKHAKGSRTAVKTMNKCVYKVTQGAFMVEPGCYTIYDQTAVGCVRSSSDSIEIRTFQVDNNGNVNAPAGLRKC